MRLEANLLQVLNYAAAAGEVYDLTWLKDLKLPYLQYQSADPLRAHYFVDNANEAGAYLRFIHDYYNCLPEVSHRSLPSAQ